MEKIQGQNKLCVNSLDQRVIVRRSLQVQGATEDQRFALEEDPFLQMMQQSEDPSSVLSFKDPNFLSLLSLQTLQKPPWELGDYLPHEVPEFHSPVNYQNPSLGRINEAISSQELELNPQRKRRDNHLPASSSVSREKRKRRRTKPVKNTEETETQRMTHIAVERNRRRQMNVHLNSLRSLIPSSYILRGDQASIVGGAIDFVKILEQQLQSLEAKKLLTQQTDSKDVISLRASSEEETSKLRIDATVIESHVNLKIQCLKKQGQLLKSIIWLEKLGFTVLHLNVTSPCSASVSYSYNLKMEEDCVLGSADEITAAVRQIFHC